MPRGTVFSSFSLSLSFFFSFSPLRKAQALVQNGLAASRRRRPRATAAAAGLEHQQHPIRNPLPPPSLAADTHTRGRERNGWRRQETAGARPSKRPVGQVGRELRGLAAAAAAAAAGARAVLL